MSLLLHGSHWLSRLWVFCPIDELLLNGPLAGMGFFKSDAKIKKNLRFGLKIFRKIFLFAFSHF